MALNYFYRPLEQLHSRTNELLTMQKSCTCLLKIVTILLTTGIRSNVSYKPDAVGNTFSVGYNPANNLEKS